MPKPRRENSRPVRDRILILCEGIKTEPKYFNGIKADIHLKNRLSALRIEILDTKINTGKELVKKAKELKEDAEQEGNPYDKIWVVLDRDGYTKHPQAFNQAKDNNIHIAFSCVAFEYWFLLHFEKTAKAFNKADELIRHLKTKGYSNYEKSLNHYGFLKEKTEFAIKNAVWIREKHHYYEESSQSHERHKLNPFTDVDKLVAYLLNLDSD